MSSIWKSCPKNREKKIQPRPDTGPQRHSWPCPPNVCWNLVRDSLSGRFAFKKETGKKMLQCAKLDKNVTSSSHCEYIQRRSGEKFNSECLQLSVKHGGGSVMVWGCISASGVGDLVSIDGNMNEESTSDFDSPLNTVSEASDWQSFHFSAWQCSAVKPYLDIKIHNGTLSVIDWPHKSKTKKKIRGQNKRQPAATEELWISLKMPGELFLKTT